ncbi:MAG: hypothetical protein WC919_04455 [Candidatus Paceibacterota bacterium]|jgi:hypothetical protein
MPTINIEHIIIAIIIVVIVMYIISRMREGLTVLPLDDIAVKVAPVPPSSDATAIPAIEVVSELPMSDMHTTHDGDARYTDEERTANPPTHTGPVALTYDAAYARHMTMVGARDKRMYDAIDTRTLDYWRPIYEQELDQCENRDWWDFVDYPMNNPGATIPDDLEETSAP